MTTVTIHAAKTQLSKLIARVEAGEEVIIARRDKPVARLVPVEQARPKRRFGSMKGKVWIGPEFFDPLPEEELRLWEGEDE
jgi:prevent-host-death family protein